MVDSSSVIFDSELYAPESELQIGNVGDRFFVPDSEDVDAGCFVPKTQEQRGDVGLLGTELKATCEEMEDSAAGMEVEASFFVPDSKDVEDGIFVLDSEDLDDGVEVEAASMEVEAAGTKVDDDDLGMEVEEYYRPFYLSMLKIMLPTYFDRKSK
ncbi:hypothetical protein E2562_019753 [Oryza meyeriana var. granulata]|uniref:Uncharacterized protein n=1 Tax=Oryza meyeriana var. granulata TaxID=110450 RepID=A0A6G1C9K1_9ORYZ|nr:hypothetical protein E2562_019753 [Oryza meyeriana var. granulata]